MAHATCLLVLSLTEWVDVDSPLSAHSSTFQFDGSAVRLVFSDEFERDGRTFHDGEDTRWAAVSLPPATNEQVNWYNTSLANTKDGKLEMWAINQDVTFPVNQSFETRHLQTPMLQTWNKFCITGGAVDVRAKMPGLPNQEGLWPAFWLMGNLGRATFSYSTDGLWPFIFDVCVPHDSPDCFANQCTAQKISACNPDPGFGMNPFQGRGAPEIDVIEVQPGKAVLNYAGQPGCADPTEEIINAISVPQPLVSTSLQAAPGIPKEADQRPHKGCAPEPFRLSDNTTVIEWFPELDPFKIRNSSAYLVGVNYEFWGDVYTEYMQGVGLQTDAYSVNTHLSASYWESYHTYHIEWRTGRDGFMLWALDGVTQFEIRASLLWTERTVTVNGVFNGTRRALHIPDEPMYLILNIDSSPRWGWPSHSKEGGCDAPCECCYDCRRLECTRCMKDDGFGNLVNIRGWLANLCDTLPAVYLVDYVRVYQPADAVSIGCDPPSHPTRVWIASHEVQYKTPEMEIPLRAVVPGGGSCLADEDCGSHGHGRCTDRRCVCTSKNWTGPRCLSQAAGDALACRDFEDEARDTELFKLQSEPCAAPTGYNVSWLRLLSSTVCTHAAEDSGGGGGAGWRGWRTAQACRDVNLTSTQAVYAMCSEFARATHVVRSWLVDTDYSRCCNLVSIDRNGATLLHCRERNLPFELPLTAVAVVAFGVLVGLLVGCRQRHAKVVRSYPVHAEAEQPVAQQSDLILVRALLMCCGEKARAERRAVAERLRVRFGFQKSSCECQLHHLETLLVSHLSTSDGDMEIAVKNLHFSLLEQFERWLLHVSFRSTVTGGDHGVKTAVSNLSKKQKKQRVNWLLDDYEAVHRTWSQQTVDEMLQEVILYLLIWGEAGNLRFMPELLCFLFELAREYLLSPLPEGEAVSDSEYLDNIVEPIYARIFHETFSSVVKGRPVSLPDSMLPEFPKNYDDFNECFWSLGAIATLHTRGVNGMDSCPILAAPTGQRWKLLKDADWNAFFTNQSKTFRETRWWYCLLAANRRIILLHLVGFCLCFTVSLPEEWELNGWGSLAVLPVACMIPTSVRVAGAFFDVWAMHTKFVRQTLKDSISTWLLTLVGSGLVLWLETEYQYDVLTKSVEKYSTEAAVRTWLPVLMTVLTGFTFRELVLELLPARAPPNDFDSNLFFESRTAALLREPWFKHGHFWNLREEVLDVIRMYAFWILVWTLKIVLAYTLLFPNIFDAHRAIDACFPHDQLVSLGESRLSLFARPSYQIQLVLLVGLWTSSLIVFFTDTLLWYNCVTALWGGKLGIMRVLAARKVHFKNSSIKQAAMRKLSLQSSESWATIWKAIVTDLYQEDLISAAQRDDLVAGNSEVLLKGKARSRCKEAFRRLHFLEYSFSDANMPDSPGALRTPSLTVLIPHYAELLLVPASAFDLTMFKNASSDEPSFSRLSSTDQLQPAKKSVRNVVAMLMAYFSHDWVRFVRRMLGEDERLRNATDASSFSRKKSKRVPIVESAASTTGKNLLLAARQWASLRLQTMHRTVAGMMKNRLALKLLLRAELPDISKESLDQLVDAKFSCVAAMQRYHVMTDEEREDVEVMLNLWPSLVIAYIEEEKVDATYSRFFSCTIDGRCKKLSDGSRVPKHRVRLPGHPILGNGKSDNQNHALIFCHGTVIQAIDANQEGYLTEAIKLSNAMQSFYVNMAGAWRGPAIVGFREHIFSNLGLMGDLGASSEAAFGTLVQRTMASVLWSRYHYGHPDMLDKCAMMAQGGISKATKGLNLSEDIFAGMDAMLRGHTVVHREFFEVGKGRDMGFLSILGFFSKLSMGTAQMSTSRQAYRLGTRLGLARLCGFYYAHIGYYVGQLHFYHASFSLFALMFVGTLADQTGVLPLSAFGSTHVVKSVYNTLHVIFISASLLPLFMLLLAERGWFVAITRPLRQLCSGSTFFYIFMSRCVAHFISGEFASGGAMYIPTGRGVATERQNFSILFSSFALPCIYPGAELAALLLLPYIMLPSLNLGWSFFSLAGLMPTSLLFAPLMFNPGCFKLKAQCADIQQWLHWLCDSGDTGWGGHHRALCARKRTVRLRSFVLPSKLMLLSFPIAVVAYGAMEPLGWDTRHMTVLTLPIIPAAISAVLVVLCAAIREAASTRTRCLIVPAAALFAAAAAAEVAFVVYSQPRLPLAHWVALVSARYTAWRWVANSATYFCEVGGLVRDDVTSNSSRYERAFKRVGRFLRDVVVVGVAGHAWLVDAILGGALQSVALCLCFVPGLTWAHTFCLFETSTQSFKQSVDVQEEDVRSISRRLTRRDRKQKREELPADEGTHRRSGYMTQRKISARRVAEVSMRMASRRRSKPPKNEPPEVDDDDDDDESDETLGNFATFLSVVAGEKQKPNYALAAATKRDVTPPAHRVAIGQRLEDLASGASSMKPLGALEA